ncbi:MAG: 2'-5' RNA ligase family protein [Bacteroidota bacterium]
MTRKQLTLFLDEIESEPIEWIRRTYNPIQYDLIKSHITLCREDEIEDLTHILINLEEIDIQQFELKTEGVKRFSNGKGVFIPVLDEEHNFRELRRLILKHAEYPPREHKAHVTIMHPRNSTCNDDIFSEIVKVKIPKILSIKKISLIEQEIGKEWRILSEFSLKKKEI